MTWPEVKSQLLFDQISGLLKNASKGQLRTIELRTTVEQFRPDLIDNDSNPYIFFTRINWFKVNNDKAFLSSTNDDLLVAVIALIIRFDDQLITGKSEKWLNRDVSSWLGYGNRPRTSEGKLATIIYAIVGIPLMLFFLVNIGHLLAKKFMSIYNYCCNCSNSDASNEHENLHAHHHMHDHYHVHHIALNEISPPGHMVHCNSNADPYRTPKCYSACNSNSNRDQYGIGTMEAETKLCTDIDHHSCAGTLNRAHSHSHPSILRGTTSSDLINANHVSAHNPSEDQKATVPLVMCVLLIICYILLGASVLNAWEGCAILDGSYIAFCLLRSDNRLNICLIWLPLVNCKLNSMSLNFDCELSREPQALTRRDIETKTKICLPSASNNEPNRWRCLSLSVSQSDLCVCECV